MFLLTTVLFVSCVLLSVAQVTPPGSGTNSSGMLANVTMAFKEAHVVPDVIPSFDPVVGADVLFMDPSTTEAIQVVPDILLTMEQTKNPPQYLLSSNNTNLSRSNVSWVITIVDPDAPANASQFLHFIGQDFKVDHSGTRVGVVNATGLANSSQALVKYFPPSPPAGSDPHRYVVLVYVQPDDFNSTASKFFNGTIGAGIDLPIAGRMKFNLTSFAANTSLGNPVAGNFFLVGPANTTTPPIPSDTSPFPSPSATSPSLSILSKGPLPPTSSPTSTGGSTDSTSGAERLVSRVLLMVLGVLSVAFGLAV